MRLKYNTILTFIFKRFSLFFVGACLFNWRAVEAAGSEHIDFIFQVHARCFQYNTDYRLKNSDCLKCVRLHASLSFSF